MKYWVIDDETRAKGEVYVECFDTEEEAIDRAEDLFAHMSKNEEEACQGLYVALVEEDEDGYMNWDTIFEIIAEYI